MLPGTWWVSGAWRNCGVSLSSAWDLQPLACWVKPCLPPLPGLSCGPDEVTELGLGHSSRKVSFGLRQGSVAPPQALPPPRTVALGTLGSQSPISSAEMRGASEERPCMVAMGAMSSVPGPPWGLHSRILSLPEGHWLLRSTGGLRGSLRVLGWGARGWLQGTQVGPGIHEGCPDRHLTAWSWFSST